MIKLMIAVVILACVAPFFIRGPDGQPLMTVEKILSNESKQRAAEPAPVEPVTVYKWKDENGVWHFSDREQDAGIAGAEKMELDGKINLMPAYREPPGAAAPDATPTNAVPVPSIGAGLDALNQAKELQSTVDNRKNDIDKALKQAGAG